MESAKENAKEKETRTHVLEILGSFGESAHAFEGKQPGKKILVIGGTHGNELLGIFVVGMLKEALKEEAIKLESGSVTLMLGNTKAIAAGERWAPGGRDLNRVFTNAVVSGEQHAGWEGKRAALMAKEIQKADIVIDLHATNKPSDPFVFAKITPENKGIYKWFRASAVVEDPARLVSKGGGTVDEYAEDVGAAGICFESGLAGDVESVAKVYDSVLAILAEQKLTNAMPPEAAVSDAPEYTVVTEVSYPGSVVSFTEEKGKNFAPVAEGEVIGYYGQDIPVLAPAGGYMLFPKKPEHQKNEGAVCYIVAKKSV